MPIELSDKLMQNFTAFSNQLGGSEYLTKQNTINWCYNQHFILNYNANWLIFTALLFYFVYTFCIDYPELAEKYLSYKINLFNKWQLDFTIEGLKISCLQMIRFCLILFLVLWIIQANGITYFDNVLEFFRIKQTWQLN